MNENFLYNNKPPKDSLLAFSIERIINDIPTSKNNGRIKTTPQPIINQTKFLKNPDAIFPSFQSPQKSTNQSLKTSRSVLDLSKSRLDSIRASFPSPFSSHRFERIHTTSSSYQSHDALKNYKTSPKSVFPRSLDTLSDSKNDLFRPYKHNSENSKVFEKSTHPYQNLGYKYLDQHLPNICHNEESKSVTISHKRPKAFHAFVQNQQEVPSSSEHQSTFMYKFQSLYYKCFQKKITTSESEKNSYIFKNFTPNDLRIISDQFLQQNWPKSSLHKELTDENPKITKTPQKEAFKPSKTFECPDCGKSFNAQYNLTRFVVFQKINIIAHNDAIKQY